MNSKPTAPVSETLLRLRSGLGAPVFIAHGLGGSVLGLTDLVGKMETGHPIYGMQARGIDGIDEPLTSIETRALYHLAAIKQLQPRGPYFLVGYSLGGLEMLEIAQRLAAGGEEVALLALVDAYPHRRHLPVAQRARLSVRLAARNVWSLIASPLSRTRAQIPEGAAADALNRRDSEAIRRVMRRMQEADYLALRDYRPQFYRGRIRFVRAEISSYFPDNPSVVWSHLAEKFDVDTVAGDHVGMIATHFEDLAVVVSRYLAEATS